MLHVLYDLKTPSAGDLIIPTINKSQGCPTDNNLNLFGPTIKY